MNLLRRTIRLSSWRLFWLLIVLAGVLAGILVTLIYQGLSLRSSGPGELAVPRLIPNTDVSPYGANFFLAREVEPWKLDKTLEMAADAGIVWVKQQFSWEEIEPVRKGEYLLPTTKTDSWAKYDRIVDACEAHGLQIVARLDRPPGWSREDNTYAERPPDDFEDYGDFVYEFVKRYEGRINYVQIWNEPNIFPEWGNRPVDPAGYVELLQVAYRRAKEANPNVYVLCAPLAITLGQEHPDEGKWIAMNDLDYLKAMYEAGAADHFDIYAANAFGMDRPPEDPADPDVLNFQRVLLHREIMERYGDSDKAVWFNEYGWNAAPETMSADELTWQRVSEQDQAEYTLRGIEMAREEWPWAGVFMLWYFRQVGNIPADRADYYFRIVDPDFTPRQIYFSLQDVAERSEPVGEGLYQETNPAVEMSGSWENVIDGTASGGAYRQSSTVGDSVTFLFVGSRVELISRAGPTGGRLQVTLDGHSMPGLPVDGDGVSYVDLYRVDGTARESIAVVPETTVNEHTLRVTVTEGGPGEVCAVDAFQVRAEQNERFPLAATIAAAVALVLDGWMIRRVWHQVRWYLHGPSGTSR